MMKETTKFKEDIKKGKVGEQIFIEDFLSFMGINYEDVSGNKKFQVKDTDFLSTIWTYEVKSNYKDDEKIFIEEYTNINEELAPISMGWYYKTKANKLVFISSKTRSMIIIPFTDEFKAKYESIKNKYKLFRNRVSERNGRKWQSAFRIIPLSELEGYYSIYKKS